MAASKIADLAGALASEGLERAASAQPDLPRDAEWAKVRDVGTRLWLDTGDLDEARRLYTAEFEALTTNNTLLNKEVQKGIYDEFVPKAAGALRDADPALSERELLLEIAFILNARHGLRLVEAFGARVSVELHTDLADDVERSVAYGLRYHAVCPERFIVKVPFTAAGLLAARELGRQGVPVNFTLGFSARQNRLAAILADPNWVNVFMGRLNAFVSDNGLGSGKNVGEKATLSTQRELIALREAGRTRSRLIGASMREGAQVAALAGLDVFTMPTKVAAQYREAPAETLTSRVLDDPEVPLAPGVTPEAFGGDTLWEVTPDFRAAVDALMAAGPDQLTPDAVIAHFERTTVRGIFPRFSDDDVAVAARDGKIPVLDHWKERLQSGEVGLDALMNLSALHSFVADQKALDDRVQSLIT